MSYYRISIKSLICLALLISIKFEGLCQNISTSVLRTDIEIKSNYSYAPFLDLNDQLLYITKRIVSFDGDTVDRIYSFKYDENLPTRTKNPQSFSISQIPYEMSSIGTCNMSLDGKTIVFSSAIIKTDTTWFIMIGKKSDSNYEYTSIIDSGKSWMGHPCLSIDDSLIIYSAIKQPATKSDLYYVKKRDNGKWTKPEFLSEKVNSDYEEISPYLSYHRNNLYLYYSSDRPDGKGGFDLYSTEFNHYTKTWTAPKPIDEINTNFDEAFPSTPHDIEAENILLFSSNRDNNDEWQIYITEPNPVSPKYIIVEGIVYDKTYSDKILPITNSNVVFRDYETSKSISILKVDDAGHYITKMPLDRKLFVEAFASGKANIDTLVYYDSRQLFGMKNVWLDFYLKDTFSLVTDTVFFEYRKSDLKINSKVELVLQRISDYLIMYPKNEIEIVGHTDFIGGLDYNKDLSLRRANAVVDTLINRGVNSSTLISKGVAFEYPLHGFEDCTTEEECAPNRRVEIIYLYRKE